MRHLRIVLFVVVCTFATGVWAQGAPQVFVSTGIAGNIYSLNTATGRTKLLVATSGADYEGMVVAPDNALGASHPYLVYACDSNNSKIVRFDPSAAAPIKPQLVYSGGLLSHPQCGRITSSGDLVVSSKDGGLWNIAGITAVELGTSDLSPTVVQLANVSGVGAGLAEKNNGDMLVVSNSQVLRAKFPAFPSAAGFITSGLSAPIGIARRSDGFIFVSNQGSNNVLRFDAQGKNSTSCQSFQKKDVPFFMQAALDDTLYVAISESNKGLVQAVNGNSCKLIQSFSVPNPAVGIALDPTGIATQPVIASNGSALISFGFTALEMNHISGTCGGIVSVSLASIETINSLIAKTGLPPGGADPAVNLGLDGFETVISTANVSGCAASDGLTFNFQIAHFLDDAHVGNPEIVSCVDDNSTCETADSPTGVTPIGIWPLGGYLPQDGATGGRKSLKCNLFMVSAHPTGQQGQEDGTFCGFQSPINTTFDPVADAQNQSLAATFSAGKSIPVKFKLAPGTTSKCQSAPYLSGAIAILSVAQIADSKGNPTFMPIGLISNGSSGLGQPLFKGDGNNQYLFNWDSSSCILPSGATVTCPKGRYSLSIVFLTDNTANSTTTPPQSVYTQQTAEIVLK